GYSTRTRTGRTVLQDHRSFHRDERNRDKNEKGMKTSIRGKELIKKYEGLSLKAYPDPATGGDPWTIGYGTIIYPSGEPVHPGDVITEEEAEDYLINDLEQFEKHVNDLVTVKLNQNQFDALVSFVYNLGPYNLQSSTLLKELNRGNYAGAAQQFDRWVFA